MKKLLKKQKSPLKKGTNSSITFLKYSLLFFILISLLIHLLLYSTVHYALLKSFPHTNHPNNINFKLLNNNNDNNQTPTKDTDFASEKNSRAQGKLTKEKGLNKAAPLTKPKNAIQKGLKKKSNQKSKKTSIFMTFYKKTKIIFKKDKKLQTELTSVPSHYNFNQKEALNTGTDGSLSYNAKLFKDAKYFKKMVKKISQHWYPAIPAYAHYMGLIPSGEVKIAFILNRKGELVDYKLISDFNYKTITRSCIYAITHAAPFDPLPASVQGQTVLIPFTFQYINPRTH